MMIHLADVPVWPVLADLDGNYQIFKLMDRLMALCARLPAGVPVDLDRRLIDSGKVPALGVTEPHNYALAASERAADDDYGTEVGRQLLDWPFAATLWPSANTPFLWEDFTRSARIIAGQDRLRLRDMSVRGCRADVQLQYAAPDRIIAAMRQLLDQMNHNPDRLDPLLLAIGVLKQFLHIHPFDDGNGRIARWLFQIALAIHAGLPGPYLPLWPLMRTNRVAFLAAYRCWEFDGNPMVLIDITTSWVDRLITLYEAELRI